MNGALELEAGRWRYAARHALEAFARYGSLARALEIRIVGPWPLPPELEAEADRRGGGSFADDTPWWDGASPN